MIGQPCVIEEILVKIFDDRFNYLASIDYHVIERVCCKLRGTEFQSDFFQKALIIKFNA